MINLRDLTLAEMEALVREMGQPAFRAKQIFQGSEKGKKTSGDAQSSGSFSTDAF